MGRSRVWEAFTARKHTLCYAHSCVVCEERKQTRGTRRQSPTQPPPYQIGSGVTELPREVGDCLPLVVSGNGEGRGGVCARAAADTTIAGVELGLPVSGCIEWEV